MHALMQTAYLVRRWFLRVFRIRTHGVKVMVFNGAGELLLIRNTYGKTHLWTLPGGGIKRGEAPDAAALREVREEVGLEVRDLAFIARHLNTKEGKRDTIHLFTARTDEEAVADGVEVEEARFFPLDAVPDATSAATARRILEHREERPRSSDW